MFELERQRKLDERDSLVTQIEELERELYRDPDDGAIKADLRHLTQRLEELSGDLDKDPEEPQI